VGHLEEASERLTFKRKKAYSTFAAKKLIQKLSFLNAE